MQKVIERVIESKNYELSDMLRKIDTLWVQGSIDDAVRKSLADKARSNANTQNSMDILSKLEELDKRVKALEDVSNEPEKPNEEPTETTYPEYKARDWYYTGNRVTFDGKVYECIAPKGTTCVWSPSDFPKYWSEVTE